MGSSISIYRIVCNGFNRLSCRMQHIYAGLFAGERLLLLRLWLQDCVYACASICMNIMYPFDFLAFVWWHTFKLLLAILSTHEQCIFVCLPKCTYRLNTLNKSIRIAFWTAFHSFDAPRPFCVVQFTIYPLSITPSLPFLSIPLIQCKFRCASSARKTIETIFLNIVGVCLLIHHRNIISIQLNLQNHVSFAYIPMFGNGRSNDATVVVCARVWYEPVLIFQTNKSCLHRIASLTPYMFDTIECTVLIGSLLCIPAIHTNTLF